MASIAGLRGTGDWGADERPKNFREMILWRNPNGSAPLTALMGRMKTEKVDDPEFSWWEEELNPVRVTTGGDLAAASTSVTLAGGGLDLVPGDVLLVEKTELAAYDNEIVLVSSVTSDTVIVVKRGQAGSDAAGIVTGASLTKIGNTYEEGSNSPDTSTRNPTKQKNYAQIFKTAYQITNTARLTRARTGDPLKNDRKRKMFDHSVALEFAWLFGKAFEDTSGTKPKRYTGGVRSFLSSNVKIYTTTPTEDDFLDAVYKVWDYDVGSGGGNERIVFAGNAALNALNKLARNSSSTRINFDGTISTYGMNLQRWVFPQGTLYVRTHPLMNVHARYDKSMFILDPSNIIYRPMRDTKHQDNIQPRDADYLKGQWLTEAGLEFRHEKTMGYIGNFVV